MPEWFMHDRFAIRMGSSQIISESINRLIDFPWDHDDFSRFYLSKQKPTLIKTVKNLFKIKNDNDLIRKVITHDGGRTSKNTMRIQHEFLKSFNDLNYISTWFLHHFLDYIEGVGEDYHKDEVLRRINDRFSGSSNLFLEIQNDVSEFVNNHYEEISFEILERKVAREAMNKKRVMDADNSNRNLSLYESIQQAAKRDKEKD